MSFTQVVFFSFWACNRIADMWDFIVKTTNRWMGCIGNYFSGLSNTWYFLTGFNTPIPASHYGNVTHGIHTSHRIKWSYDSATHTLIRHPDDMEQISQLQTFSWLSASIMAGTTTFALDDWIPNFHYEQSNDTWFNPRILAACWSIDSKIWFTPRDNPILQVIDENGDFYNFPLTDEFDVDQWLTCLGDVGDSDEEDDIEDSENAADEQQPDEEDEQAVEEEQQQPVAAEEQPVAAEEQPVAAEEQPVAEQQPVAEEQQPVAATQLSTSVPSELPSDEID